jgi:phage tail-like protein
MSQAALTGARFRVEIEGLTATDFVEVLFPEATILDGRQQLTHLVLRRGVGPDRELSDWWAQAAGKHAPKTLSVTLLDERGEAQVRWKVHGARPVRYALSSLNAIQPAVVMETIELAVEGLERG